MADTRDVTLKKKKNQEKEKKRAVPRGANLVEQAVLRISVPRCSPGGCITG